MVFPLSFQPLGKFSISVAWLSTDTKTAPGEQQTWGAAVGPTQIAAATALDIPKGGR